MRTIPLVIALAVLVPATAEAGRGSSYSAIMSALQTGNRDVIISELERAEKLLCSRCIAPVRRLLDHDDYQIREVAAWWIGRRPAVKRQVSLEAEARLRGTDPVLARNAADALGTFRHPDAVPILVATMGRADFPSSVRASAIRALGRIRHGGGEEAVLMGLADAGADARAAAIDAYPRIRGTRDGSQLAALVSDSDAQVRRKAAAAVGRYKVASARPALEQVLASDSDPIARRNAAWALGQLGDPASRAALEAAATGDSISYVRSIAQASLRLVR